MLHIVKQGSRLRRALRCSVAATAFALLAGSLRALGPGAGTRRWLDRLGGSMLIGAAAMMAAWRRAT